ncbi:isoprenylcysteine carboxylmethyltransferase family protein [Mesorhizobium sp. CAU 1732]|uniref:methyltransferase family protein n=1 Tax=Mesorhizobium sp. CAU 1732 TaxID=3140358 RepID=UPI0032603170
MSTNDPAALARFQRARRFVLFALILVATAGLLFCGSAPQGSELHEFVEAVGLGLIGVAIVGRLWCTVYIGGRKAAEIVDRGPYSISRNPLYVFSTLAAAGVGAQTGSIVIAGLFAVISANAFHVVILREEAYLKANFGAAFTAYMQRVPRFLPRFSLYRDAETVTLRPDRLYRTLGDGLVFFVAVPVFETIEALQASGSLPVLLRLP